MALYHYNATNRVGVTPRDPPERLSDEQLSRYKELLHAADADAVQDLLARHGPGILSREIPYLVVAARNQLAGFPSSRPPRAPSGTRWRR